jgi:hypothetical protein
MNFEKLQIKAEQEKSEKELAWEKKQKEIDEITDIVGHKIDEGIKETVIAFEMNGLPTHNSCEGHIDHGFPYPFVEVIAEEKPRWKYKGQKEIFKQVAEEKGVPFEKTERDSPEWDINLYEEIENEAGKRLNFKNEEELAETEKYKEWKKINKEIFKKAQDLLQEYNKNKEQDTSDTEIILEGNEETDFTFRPQSGFDRSVDTIQYMEEREKNNWKLTEEEKIRLYEKLRQRRASMKKFTEFLREKYLSVN